MVIRVCNQIMLMKIQIPGISAHSDLTGSITHPWYLWKEAFHDLMREKEFSIKNVSPPPLAVPLLSCSMFYARTNG